MTTEMLISVVKDGRSTPEILMELEKRIPGAIEQIKIEGQPGQAFNIKQHILDQYDPDKRAVEEDFLYDLRENIDSNYREPMAPLPKAWMAQGGRIGYRGGKGVASLQAGAPDIKYEGDMRMASAVGDESDDIAMELFGRPVKELTPPELDELNIYLDNLQK